MIFKPGHRQKVKWVCKYVAQVLPADVGHRLPPWFFLMPSYWRDPKLDYVDEKLLAHLLAAGEQKVRLH